MPKEENNQSVTHMGSSGLDRITHNKQVILGGNPLPHSQGIRLRNHLCQRWPSWPNSQEIHSKGPSKTQKVSFHKAHFRWFPISKWIPWLKFLEIRSAGSPLTEVIPLTKSQHPDFGFPEGRLHRTERASIAKIWNMFAKKYRFVSRFWNMEIEMLEYAWEHFPHIQKSRSRKNADLDKHTPHLYKKF